MKLYNESEKGVHYWSAETGASVTMKTSALWENKQGWELWLKVPNVYE